MPVERLTPERRREMTRTLLLEAAAEVFAARGFHGATVDDVAEAAGFTKGAVYSNFGSKDDLFLALVRERQARMVADFFAAADPAETASGPEAITDVYMRLSPTESEWALWEEFVLYALRDPEARKKLRADGRAAFEFLVATVDERWREAGVVPPLPPEALARLYLAVFDGVARQRVLDPERVDEDLFASLVGFVNDAVHALGRPRRRR